jgi:hypothetical protein
MATGLKNRPSSPYDDTDSDSDKGFGQEYYDRKFDDIAKSNPDLAKLGEQEESASQDQASPETSGQKSATPEEIKESEDSNRFSNYYNKYLKNDDESSWYNQASPGRGKKAVKNFFRRQKKALIITLVLNLIVAGIILMFALLGPLKHMHFETILRSVNFARYQLMVRKQFTRVIFEASVLTDKSEGTFRRSLLVRQIATITPDRQLARLGREGRVQWDFRPNGSFGNTVLPLRESLRAVVIDGQRVDIDNIARENFGRNYRGLSLREKWAVQSRFVNAVNSKLGPLMALQPRTVRWNPMERVRLKASISLVKFLNAARDYAGKNPDQARALYIEDTIRNVRGPAAVRFASGNSDIREAADATWDETVDALKEGRAPPAPGEIRARLAGNVRHVRAASDAAFVVTLMCIIRELAVFFADGQAAREMQALRFAADMMTTTDQIKAGDVTGEAVGAANARWDANGTVPDASQSAIYKQVTGQPVNPQDPNYQQQILNTPMLSQNSMLQDISQGTLNYIDGGLIGVATGQVSDFQRTVMQSACNVLLHPASQIVIGIAELVIAAFSLGAVKGITVGIMKGLELAFHFAVGMGLGELLNWMIEMLVKNYAQTDFALEQGSEAFNAGYVAQNYMSQTANREVVYGRPLAEQEASTAQEVAMNALKAENQQKPFTERYFATDSPYSMLSFAAAKLPTSAGGLAGSLRNGTTFIGSLLSSPFKIIGNIGNGIFKPANAAGVGPTGDTFGVEEWGWSVDEQRRIETDETFALESLIEIVEPRLDELNERYGKCYNNDSFVLQDERPDGCNRGLLSAGHPEYGDDALYWRYYNSMVFAAERLTGPL